MAANDHEDLFDSPKENNGRSTNSNSAAAKDAIRAKVLAAQQRVEAAKNNSTSAAAPASSSSSTAPVSDNVLASKTSTVSNNSSSSVNPGLQCATCLIKLKPEFATKCPLCERTYCLKHRFEDDHQCWDLAEEIGKSLISNPPTNSNSFKPMTDSQWELLLKLANNAITKGNPASISNTKGEDPKKFRTLKKDNEKLKKEIFSSSLAVRILRCLGFKDEPVFGGAGQMVLEERNIARVKYALGKSVSNVEELKKLRTRIEMKVGIGV